MIDRLNSKLDKNDKAICSRIFLWTFILKIFYSLMVQYDISAHDLWDPSDWTNITTGSLGYIQYIYQYHALPPYMDGQFYHPPLYYIISSLVMAVTYGPTKDLTIAFEAIQTVTMIMAFLLTIVCYKLFIELGIRGHKLFYATLFICCCPTLYNMGACINNDCLMTLFCALVLLYAVKWQKNYKWSSIILMALFLALGMLSKTSAVLLAPALGIMFLYVLYKERKDRKVLSRIILQYISFAVVSIPLGMSFLIRNYLMFKMPFNYVMPLIGVEPFDVSLWGRIGIPSLRQMTECITDFNDIPNFSNIWGQIIQSMLFDEMIFNTEIKFFNAIGIVLIWITMLLLIILLVEFLRFLIYKKSEITSRILLGISWVTLFASFILFCFQYKFICTMNMRYIFITLIALIAGYGLAPIRNGKLGKTMNSVLSVLIMLFSALSLVLYILPVPLSFG